MISPHGQLRAYVPMRPVDFRKGIDGLALAVQEVMGLDPFSGAAFIFRAKRADRIKILIWDRTGMVLVHKRLKDAKFVSYGLCQRFCAQVIALPVRAAILVGTIRIGEDVG